MEKKNCFIHMDSIITRISVCYCHLCVDVVIIYLYLFAGQKGFCKIICRPLVLEGLLHETYNANMLLSRTLIIILSEIAVHVNHKIKLVANPI